MSNPTIQAIKSTPRSQSDHSRNAYATGREGLAIRRARQADDMAHKGVRIPFDAFCDRFFPLPPGVLAPERQRNPFFELADCKTWSEQKVADAFVSSRQYIRIERMY